MIKALRELEILRTYVLYMKIPQMQMEQDSDITYNSALSDVIKTIDKRIKLIKKRIELEKLNGK